MLVQMAWRNLWRNKRRTVITVCAISFAVFCSVFMQSINRGSHEVMIDNVLNFHVGHIQIQDYRYHDESSLDNSFFYSEEVERKILQLGSRVREVVPRLEAYMLVGNEDALRGSVVFGIDIEREDSFNNIVGHLQKGRFFDPHQRGAVIGRGLANRLNVKVGGSVILMGQGRFGMSANDMVPVLGIVNHPVRELNDNLVYLDIKYAQDLFSAQDHVSMALISLSRLRDIRDVAIELEKIMPEDLVVYEWRELIPELLQLLQFDLAGAYFLSFILYLVISFGLFSTIFTMSLERLKEFGVLLSLGMSRLLLSRIIVYESFMMSVLGVIFGILCSFIILSYFYFNPIELTGELAQTVIDMGWEPVLPMSFAADQFYGQAVIVFLIAFMIAIFPILKIMRLNILEAAKK